MAKARKLTSSASPRPAAKAAPVRRKSARRAASAAEISGRGIDLLRMAALAIICVSIWCTIYNRWSAANWGVPLEYGLDPAAMDVKDVLGGLKAAEDGYLFPGVFHSVPQLNAPYGANWNDVPVNEDVMFWFTGVVARAIGIFAAANFLVLACQVLAALAFYYAARRMKCGWKWSFAGALFFGMAPYGFAHSLHHVDITAYWHIPLGLLVCFWAANGDGLKFRSRDYWIAVGVAVCFGLQNVYYINAFLQLLGISLIIRWMRAGWSNWRVILPPLSIGTVAFGVFFVLMARVPLYALFHGHNSSATLRNYAQMEFYGLKLVDFFIPFPTHRIPAFAAVGKRYELWTILPAETPPACYFGLAGIAAFLWLGVHTVQRAIARPMRKMPIEPVQVLWCFFYATVGGVNAFLGVMKFQMFRSTTRFTIVIFAITLLFAARRLTLISKRWPTPWPMLAPVLIAIVGLWEVLPPTAGENIDYVSEQVNSDRLFAQEMEATLPKGGMVFQLPVMDFPESPAPGVSAYEHYRPYLYTHDLRYSYGTDKGRPESAWQRTIPGMTPAMQVAALERYGFSGIYIDPRGFPDGVELLLSEYKAAGCPDVITSQLHDLYCVVLHPSPNPVLPPPAPLFADGWYTEQDNPTGERLNLASGNANILLTNPESYPIDKYATFYIATLAPRNVTAQGDGAYQSWHADSKQPAKVTNLHLTLPPGESRIYLTTDAPATPQAQGPISFYIVNFTMSDSPQQE